jgi:asparagine synthase (glutamine-hydrolysing)
MCRIAGLWQQGDKNSSSRDTILMQMRDTLSYGGPDAAGIYTEGGLALGHRRLSILDLSEAGTQPMHWEHYAIIFNGEIYNFQEIRQTLIQAGYSFSTGTDTEIILKAFHQWGFDAVKQFRGMFAFAIWDKNTKKLMLCRDRVGVKPLYWYCKDGLFMFASELKAFHQHPDFDKTINKNAVALFLQQGYIESPQSIFQYVQKVQPGTWLEIDADFTIKTHTYWSVQDCYKTNGNGIVKDEEALTDELEAILLESFKLRMVADVPVGMFLSGGVDSSLVTAMLQKEYSMPLKTFTVGFESERYNEAGHARKVAEHIGTDHTEIFCTEDDFKALIPQLPDFYDEPFGGESALPTYMVAKLAKNRVKVCLSADGGDEMFGGYTKYEYTAKFQRYLQPIPAPVRGLLAYTTNTINPIMLENLFHKMPFLNRYTNLGAKFSKLQNALNAKDVNSFFKSASSFTAEKQLKALTMDTSTPPPDSIGIYDKYKTDFEDNYLLSHLGILDIQSFLEGHVMTKVDRATMQVALEGREPFLDHKIIEFAMQLPDSYKMKDGILKYPLRKILYKYVPQSLIERPKQGFSVPVFDWLQNSLKQEVTDLANDRQFAETLGFDETYLKKTIEQFQTKKAYVSPHFVWFLLILHLWYKRWMV